MTIGIYLNNRKLDLFPDENINITSKVTDINNIGKIFSDFSQTFTVPCSPNNNAIFGHFYDVSNDNQFNSNIRVDAYIELDTIPFKYGKIQLESVSIKGNQNDNYKITFYGNLKQLDDKFKDDELTVLDFSEYTHQYNITQVQNGLQSPTFFDNDIIYPLIGLNVWQYGSGDSYDISQNQGAVDYRELKPAIKVSKIFEKIQEYYDIEFVSDFFNSTPFLNLMLFCSKEKGKIVTLSTNQVSVFYSQGTIGDVDAHINTSTNIMSLTASANPASSGFDGNTSYTVTAKIFPSAGSDSSYTGKLYVNGQVVSESGSQTTSFVVGSGFTTYKQMQWTSTSFRSNQKVYEIYSTVQSSTNMNFTVQYEIKRKKWIDFPFAKDEDTGSVLSADMTSNVFINITEQLPKIKVKDFLTGIIKMFNMVVRPVNTNTFYIEPLNKFQDDGNIYDVTQDIDIESKTQDRPIIFSEIQFKYQKSDAILGKKFRNLFDTTGEFGYGDLRAKYEIDNKKDLKVDLPFELMMFERITNRTNGDLTNIHAGYAIDDKYEAVNLKPMLFYYNGLISHPVYPFRLTNGVEYRSMTYSHMVANINDQHIEQITTSLCWGNNIDSWTYQDINESLYNSYWDRYISSIYDLRQRKFTFNGVLRPSIINNLKINDKLIINDQRYKIEDYTINLINGETKFNLSNDIRSFNYFEGPTIDQTTLLESVTAAMGTTYREFYIRTEDSWSIGLSASGFGTGWINFQTPTSGTGNTRVLYKVDYNPSYTERSMNIIVNYGSTSSNIQLLQEA